MVGHPSKIKADIVGAAGFVGGELIRLLNNHRQVQLCTLHSESQADRAISSVHHDLFSMNRQFDRALFSEQSDIIFICKGHGQSKNFIEQHLTNYSGVIIDMSSDYRIMESGNPFIYGLPEWNKNKIQQSNRIANCGCFATAIQLALFPLLKKQLFKHDIHINGITGSTGAGHSKLDTTHFSWRSSNISIYKAFEHQHLDEVKQLIGAFQPAFNNEINFIPMRGNFTRGILISFYTKIDLSLNEALSIYEKTYEHEPFVHVTTEPIHLKQVVNTNNCLLQIEQHGDKLLVTSIIDNMIKGAAGQAIQNMNIRFGLEEFNGLQLKAAAY